MANLVLHASLAMIIQLVLLELLLTEALRRNGILKLLCHNLLKKSVLVVSIAEVVHGYVLLPAVRGVGGELV